MSQVTQKLFYFYDYLKTTECSNNVFRDAAHCAPYSSYELGTRFNFERFEIDNCDDHSGNKIEHKCQLFCRWKSKVGKHATYEKFLSNLCRCLPKDEGFMQNVCNYILKEHNLPLDCLSMDIEVHSDSSGKLFQSKLSSDLTTTINTTLDNASSLLSASVADNKYLLEHINKQGKKLKRVNQELESERKRRKISEKHLSEIEKENWELKENLCLLSARVIPVSLEEDELTTQVPLCSPPPSTDDSQSSCSTSNQTMFIQCQAVMTSISSPLPNCSPQHHIFEDEEITATDESDTNIPSFEISYQSTTLSCSVDTQNEMVTGEMLVPFDESAQLEWPPNLTPQYQ